MIVNEDSEEETVNVVAKTSRTIISAQTAEMFRPQTNLIFLNWAKALCPQRI